MTDLCIVSPEKTMSVQNMLLGIQPENVNQHSEFPVDENDNFRKILKKVLNIFHIRY